MVHAEQGKAMVNVQVRSGHGVPEFVEKWVFAVSHPKKDTCNGCDSLKLGNNVTKAITCDICRTLEVCMWCEEILDESKG